MSKRDMGHFLPYEEAIKQPGVTWTAVWKALHRLTQEGTITQETVFYIDGLLCPGCSRPCTRILTIGLWLTAEGHCTAVYGLCARCSNEQRISESRAQIVARSAESFLTAYRKQQSRKAHHERTT